MSASFTVTITPGLAAHVREGIARGLMAAAEHLLESANRAVPIEEGTLERSGTASLDAANYVSAVSYDTPYAVRQHEELDYQHDAGRTAKWLENAMTSEAARCGAIIASRARI